MASTFAARPLGLRRQSLGHESFAVFGPLALLGAASYPLPVRRPAASLHASFTPSSRSDALRFASLAVTSLREDFHLQVDAHAGRTKKKLPPQGGQLSLRFAATLLGTLASWGSVRVPAKCRAHYPKTRGWKPSPCGCNGWVSANMVTALRAGVHCFCAQLSRAFQGLRGIRSSPLKLTSL